LSDGLPQPQTYPDSANLAGQLGTFHGNFVIHWHEVHSLNFADQRESGRHVHRQGESTFGHQHGDFQPRMTTPLFARPQWGGHGAAQNRLTPPANCTHLGLHSAYFKPG